TTVLSAEEVGDGMTVVDLMMRLNMAKSRSEIRRLVEQGGITIDGEIVPSFDTLVTKDALTSGVKIRKGKKVFHKAIIG
ncbi:MAG: tyrosine--tRNA ligase, partial [Clostridia bacterium]|nr:tyrosine--tRNA ligase [Clostridia bacterium]